MLQGKGMYIWQIPEAEGGDIVELVAKAKNANMTHLLFKVANGYAPYNIVKNGEQTYDYDGVDLARQLADECRAQGIEPWGWHYVYGDYPEREVSIAVNRIQELGLVGFVVNAEGHYKGKADSVAEEYMARLPLNIPTALSSYRYPSLHMELPWKGFLKYCDFAMPQIYWMGGEPISQIEETQREYDVLLADLELDMPVFPTGFAFEEHGYKPTEQQVIDFMTEVKRLDYPGFNLYRWGEMKRLGFWPAVRDFEWPVSPAPEPTLELRVETLEQGQSDLAEDLLGVEAVCWDLHNSLGDDLDKLGEEFVSFVNMLRQDFTKLTDDLAEFKQYVETDITNLQDKDAQIDNQLSNLASWIEDANNRIGINEDDIAVLTEEIREIDRAVSNILNIHDERITNNKAVNSANRTRIEELVETSKELKRKDMDLNSANEMNNKNIGNIRTEISNVETAYKEEVERLDERINDIPGAPPEDECKGFIDWLKRLLG